MENLFEWLIEKFILFHCFSGNMEKNEFFHSLLGMSLVLLLVSLLFLWVLVLSVGF